MSGATAPVGDKQHDLLGRIDTSVLYQPFLERVNAGLNACARRGALYVATCGNRSWAEQDALYARGRTVAGGIVTNARGGQSSHNFACAIDFARHGGDSYEGKLAPVYADSAYEVLAEEMEAVGLEAGLHWASLKDAQHIQLPIRRWGLTWARLAGIYRAGGAQALFAEYARHV